MLAVAEAAATNIKEYLEKNRLDSPIRIAIQNNCSGSSLFLALDTEKQTDKVFREGGVTFLVDGKLLDATGRITVDYYTRSPGCGCGGFRLSPEKPLAGGGCGGGSCSTGFPRLQKVDNTVNKEPGEPPRPSCSCDCPSGKWALFVIALAAIGFIVARFLP